MAKTKITRNDMRTHRFAEDAKRLIKQAGVALKPLEHEYQGSAVVHFYAYRDNLFAFIATTIGLDGISERQADAGFKELQRAMMGAYGRSPPATRKNDLTIVGDDSDL